MLMNAGISPVTNITAEIDILHEDDRWQGAVPAVEALVEAAVRAALTAAEETDPLSLSVVLANDAIVRDLNRDWRDQDKPTNVLSFATRDSGMPLPPEGPEPLGDVIVAYETCVREADSDEKTLPDYLSHLIVHGVLHLLGYDHIDADDATEMEALEAEILRSLGIADPYAGSEPIET